MSNPLLRPAQNRAGESSLVRAVGVWGLAASIVNVTVGAGIFRLPTGVAEALGPAAPLAYLVCAAAMGLIVLCFAEAGSRVSLTGGLYAYVEVAFGPLVGFLMGVMLWAGMTAAMAAVSSFFADALAALVPALSSAGARSAALIVILGGLAAINIAGVGNANRFNAAMTIAKLLPLVLLVVVGALAVRREFVAWTTTPDAGDVSRASIVLMFAFLGVESALVPSGEVRNPSTTVPRAIFIAMAAVTLLYLAVQVVTQGILGPALLGQKTPVAEAAAVAMGPAGRSLILIGSVVSMFGYVSGMILAVPRVLFAFGRDGFFPSPIALVHPRYHTPYVAIAVQTLITLTLALTGTFERLAVIANGTILLVYGTCCIAVLRLRRLNIQSGGAPPFRLPFGGAVPVLALAVIVWLLTSLKADEWRALVVVVGVAVVVYFASYPARRAAKVSGSAAA